MDRWSRRQFVQGVGVAGLALVAGCGRLPWQAQEPARVPRVGYLSPGFAPSGIEWFRQGLRDLGYAEGENIALEFRFADGQIDQLPTLANELVQLPVDVIVAETGLAIIAAKEATVTIPIVLVGSNDPVGLGYVASLARPGGNITGLSLLGSELLGKRLELLKEAVPSLSRVAALWTGTDVNAFRQTQAAAEALGIHD